MKMRRRTVGLTGLVALSQTALPWAFTTSAAASAHKETALELENFISEPEEINVSSTLISGPTEMLVVDGQGTKTAANRLADRIAETGRELKYIFLSHPHFDHSQGSAILKKRFPNARFISTPDVAALQNHRIPMDDAFAAQALGDNAAIPSISAEAYSGDTIEIDGEAIEIWQGYVGDPGMGTENEPHNVLYVPSLHALIPSDIVVFDAHAFLGNSTHESRLKWVAQIDEWLTRDFNIVVPDHMPRARLADLDPRRALQHTRDYVLGYDGARAEVSSSDEMISKMLEAFPAPATVHQQALFLGVFYDFAEFRSINIDENGVMSAGPGPANEAEAAAQREAFEARKALYNP